MKKEVIIIEDNMVCSILLENYCKYYPNLSIKATFDDVDDSVVNFIQNNKVDIIFLDLHLKSTFGCDLISKISKEIKIVITTIDEKPQNCQYFDYIKKPVSFQDFQTKYIGYLTKML